MPFHTTAAGNIEPCEASVRSCPLASVEEHYETAKDAAHAAMMDALERQVDHQLVWTTPKPRRRGNATPAVQSARPRASASSLSLADFESFKRSDANRPKEIKDDWRDDIERRAAANGDLWADANPDTSVSGYWDATPDDE